MVNIDNVGGVVDLNINNKIHQIIIDIIPMI